jgi:hypothetical protein
MEVRMDENPKKRPWFQFHLSTAVVLMFVAAILLYLNLVVSWDSPFPNWRNCGWPVVAFRCESENWALTAITQWQIVYIDWPCVAFDVLFLAAWLIAIARACERHIRNERSEMATKQDGPS